MNTQTQEALKMAIEALELINEHAFRCGLAQYAIKACKEALAKCEQVEPFGYFKAEPFGWTDCADTDEGAIALYEYPPDQTAEIERLKERERKLVELIKTAKSVINSINFSHHYRLKVESDDKPVYFQREEWCMWAKNEILPVIESTIKEMETENDN